MTFEGFRDLVKLLRLSISEETGIALAEDENLEMRASAKSTAVGQFNQQTAPPGPRSSTGIPAGKSGHPQLVACPRCVLQPQSACDLSASGRQEQSTLAKVCVRGSPGHAK